jgi:allantoinase
MGQNELDVVVKGDLILQHGIARNAAVGVKDGVITALYSGMETPSAKETIDARGFLVFPGVVDSHVHSYSIQGVEGFEHSTPAAAAGGITTFIEMPYDAGAATSTPEALQEKIQRVKRMAMVDVALLQQLAFHLDRLGLPVPLSSAARSRALLFGRAILHATNRAMLLRLLQTRRSIRPC